MKKIVKILSIFLIVAIAFSACKKSDIEKANEDYNFNNVDPVIYAITGPSKTAASGLAAVSYQATPRGGSTFTWTVEGHGATITVLNPSYNVEILWDQSDVDVEAKIKCVETTSGGKTSQPAYYDVSLAKFKPMAFEDFLGDWSGIETEIETGNTYDINLTLTGDEESGTLVFAAIDGTPALMSALFEGWGELFQPGIGQEGDIILTLDLLTGGATIYCQYIGQTEPGPWDYNFSGEGTWEGFNQSMTIEYALQWDDACDANYNPSSITLTKQ